jgi:hypothetical protein
MKSVVDNAHMKFSGNLNVELLRSAGLSDILVYQYWQKQVERSDHLQGFPALLLREFIPFTCYGPH